MVVSCDFYEVLDVLVLKMCSSTENISELAGLHLCSSTSSFIVLSGDFFPVPYQHLSARTDFSQFFLGPCQANVYTSMISISSIHAWLFPKI